VAGAKKTNKTAISQQTYKADKKTQKWAIRKNANGSFTFISAANKLALQVAGSSTKSGTQIYCYAPNSKKAQSWTAVPVEALMRDGTYTLSSRLDTKHALEIESGSRKDDAKARLSAKNNKPAQKFQITNRGSNEYSIQCLASGKYLDTSGTSVVQRTGNQSDSQIWIASLSPKGGIVFTNKADGKALDVKSSSGKAKAAVRLKENKKTLNQAFMPVSTAVISSGTYYIQNIATGQVIGVASNSKKSGANVQARAKKSIDARRWILASASNGYFTIRNADSRMLLAVQGSSAKPGARVQQKKSNRTDSQKWKVAYNGDGTYTISSALGNVLGIDGNSSSDGNMNMQIGDASSAQRFLLIPTKAKNRKTDLAQQMNMPRYQFVEYMTKNKNKFLGTAYLGGRFQWSNGPWWPKGIPSPRGNKGMNCGGFVAAAMYHANGQKMTRLLRVWYNDDGIKWASAGGFAKIVEKNRENLVYYDFKTYKAMINSGILEKGDLIYTKGATGDSHIGIFWGKTSKDDKYWHSVGVACYQDGKVATKKMYENGITRIGSCERGVKYWRVIKWEG